MINSGIYALVRLDGGLIDRADAAALDLSYRPEPCLAEAVDHAQPGAVQVLRDQNRVTILLGWFDEPEALGVPGDLAPAALARAGLDRYGADLPAVAAGEWSLLDWRAGGRLTAMGSAARRDPVFFARRGPLVAIAPSVHALSRLDWIDRSIDADGLIVAIGRYQLREVFGERTWLADVNRLAPGGARWWDVAAEHSEQARRPSPVSRFAGSIHDAADEARAMLLRIVAARLARAESAACLLSGGLDSATLAWLLAEGRAPNARIDFLCSAAPLNSALPDEVALARTVANHLDLPLHTVVPSPEPSPYRPDTRRFVQGMGVPLTVRHYLYDALGERAALLSHGLLFDGCFGEATFTGQMPLATAKTYLYQFARQILRRPDPWAPFGGVSMIKLAPHRLAGLSRAIEVALDTRPAVRISPLSPRSRWQFPPGEVMRSGVPTELLPGRVRLDFPFRDARLHRLFSGFPSAFLMYKGMDRAPARLILQGRLPDPIRLQSKGGAFSPDYYLRLHMHAPIALRRIPLFRRADLDDWLDLDWLEAGLRRFAAQVPSNVAEAFEVQLTAMMAEFLLWWQSGGD